MNSSPIVETLIMGQPYEPWRPTPLLPSAAPSRPDVKIVFREEV